MTTLTTELPVADIKLWEPEKRLPMGDAELTESSWRAVAHRGTGMVMAAIMPSAVSPGFVHYEVMVLKTHEFWESKNPVYPSHVGDFLDHILSPLGLDVVSMNWSRCVAASPDRARIARAANTEFVYFLKAGPFVKIGKSTGSPEARIPDLQTGCPFPITLIAHVVGGLREEFALHRQFSDYRAHGEWFRHEGALADHIAAIQGVPA